MLRALLTLYGAFLIVAGAAFFAIPGLVIGGYGAKSLGTLETILARSAGAFMVGMGTVCWGARGAAGRVALRPVVIAVVVVNLLCSAVSLMAALAIPGFWFFWAEGVAFLILAALFAMAGRNAGLQGRRYRTNPEPEDEA